MRPFTKTFACLSLVIFALMFTASVHANDSARVRMFKNVEIRPGVGINVKAKVFVDEYSPACNRNAIAVSGFAISANTWGKFAKNLFRNSRLCKVFAIELPGRGLGAGDLPSAGLLQDITMDDDTTAVRRVMWRLMNQGKKIQTIFSHSRGTLIIEMLQQQLVKAKTNLHDVFGIESAVMFAPVPPAAVDWILGLPAVAQGLYNDFQQTPFNPALGVMIDFTNIWIGNWIDPNGEVVAGAPAFETGFTLETGDGSAQQVGATTNDGITFSRPQVDTGIFSKENGTRLIGVTFEHDSSVTPVEAENTFEYLTDDWNKHCFTTIFSSNGTEDAVHGMPVSNPKKVIRDALDACF